MLVRRSNETLGQLLIRLDRAIGKAVHEDIFTDDPRTPNPLSVCFQSSQSGDLSTRSTPFAYA